MLPYNVGTFTWDGTNVNSIFGHVRTAFAACSGVVLAVTLAAPLTGRIPAVEAQPPTPGPERVYFSETGHTVEAPFAAYFEQYGGIERFGYPITDQYVDVATSLTIQYFQKARLEYHPANPPAYQVQLGLLGDELGKRRPPLAVRDIPSATDPNCAYFDATGHAVCFQFRRFFETTGSVDLYGYPITPQILEGNRIVQYFQRARFEWHPDQPEGQRVQIAPLGSIYYDWARLDPKLLRPNVVAAQAGAIKTLRMNASVDDPFAPAGGTQRVFVQVTDQLGQPAANVAVQMIVHAPDGDTAYTLAPTDARGVTALTFLAGKYAAGTTINLELIASASGLTSTTRASYLIWYY